MQGIYTSIPETNHVSREYSFAAILQLLFMVHITLFPTLNLLYFSIKLSFQNVNHSLHIQWNGHVRMSLKGYNV